MKQHTGFSLMQPAGTDVRYRRLPDHVMHDLGPEAFCEAAANDAGECRLMRGSDPKG